MLPIPTIEVNNTIQDAAAKLLETNSSILAVTNESDLVGVITEWDITRSTAVGNPDDQPLDQVMSKQVISALPDDTILELIQKLEYHEISALPVVDKGCVQGVVTSDLLARQSLLRLLQTPL
jgi:CBS domain-containing protein